MAVYLSGPTYALTFPMFSSNHILRIGIMVAILSCFSSCHVLAIPLGRLLDRGTQTLTTTSTTMSSVKMPIWVRATLDHTHIVIHNIDLL
jgi:hypothetical protein